MAFEVISVKSVKNDGYYGRFKNGEENRFVSMPYRYYLDDGKTTRLISEGRSQEMFGLLKQF